MVRIKNAFRISFIIVLCAVFSCNGERPKHILDQGVVERNGSVIDGPAGPFRRAKVTEKADSLDSFIAGYSVENRKIEVYSLGYGKKFALVVVACLHGEEGNSYELAIRLLESYKAEPSLIPGNVTLFFMPLVNPDGYASKKRENAHGVDLNRNFPASDWLRNALDMHSIVKKGLGGEAPGSEPEVKALVSFLSQKVIPEYESACLVALHSASPPVGYVQPGYIENGTPEKNALALADAASRASGYGLLRGWTEKYPITGELIRYCAEIGIAGMDLELPTYDPPDAIPGGKKESSLESCVKLLNELLKHGGT